jgi:hypothetical protein
VNVCVASGVEALGTVDILVNYAVDARAGIPLENADAEQFLISFFHHWAIRIVLDHAGALSQSAGPGDVS